MCADTWRRHEKQTRYSRFSPTWSVIWCILFSGLALHSIVSSRSSVILPSKHVIVERLIQPRIIPWSAEERAGNDNLNFLQEWKGYQSFRRGGVVKYVRADAEIEAVSRSRQCSRVSTVLAWLMKCAEKRKESLMLAYGVLLHYHRENTIWNSSNGDYLDDDVDLWASPDAVKQIIKHEHKIFTMFGWTMRVYLKYEYVVFIQVVCSCGHKPEARVSKVIADEPAIEIYPLVRDPTSVGKIALDTWQGNKIDISFLLPTHDGVLNGLSIKIPKRSLKILDCLYGEWRTPSPEHDSGLSVCVKTTPDAIQPHRNASST